MVRAKTIILFLLLASGMCAIAQPERGGTPRSFRLKSVQINIPTLTITPPNADSLAKEDNKAARNQRPYRVGVTLPVSISVNTSGTWNTLPDGGKLWMLRLESNGAKAIGLYYSKFVLPSGSDLFIYTQDRSQVIGAFTEDNNSKDGYATRPVAGDVIILEYYQPAYVQQMPDIQITGLMYAYRSTSIFSWNPQSAFNTSGSCEVNVNCPEGANWVNQKRGVFIVLSLTHGSNYLCTGTLLNNTSLNFDQLLLTANHCAEDNSSNYSTTSDFNQYVFFMNYEAPACSTPSSAPAYSSFVGSKKLASTHNAPGGVFGSDFLLLRMSTPIADSYRPFFNGWDCNDVASPSGVAIHHPEGDVKKISTYNTPTVSSAWDVTPNTHWMVRWAATADGQGVTEAGSSGAPLFNASGVVMGALSGGDSYCPSPTAGDYFGKLSYSYTSDGPGDTLQLKPWIDPAKLGLKSISGRYKTLKPLAEFKVDTTVIPTGGTVRFTDQSLSVPTSWHWLFPGATPSESTSQNPSGIQYNTFGTYDVTLIVSNQYGSDTIVKKNYIQVNAHLYPNPTTGIINILRGYDGPSNFNIDVKDLLGRAVYYQKFQNYIGPNIQLDLSLFRGNMFIVTISSDTKVETYKVIVARQTTYN